MGIYVNRRTKTGKVVVEQSLGMKMSGSYEECLEAGMSPDQKEVFFVIDEWWKKYGYSPTLREIAYVRGKMGLGNTQRIVKRLVELGVIKRLKGKGRSIRPVYINFRNLE